MEEERFGPPENITAHQWLNSLYLDLRNVHTHSFTLRHVCVLFNSQSVSLTCRSVLALDQQLDIPLAHQIVKPSPRQILFRIAVFRLAVLFLISHAYG